MRRSVCIVVLAVAALAAPGCGEGGPEKADVADYGGEAEAEAETAAEFGGDAIDIPPDGGAEDPGATEGEAGDVAIPDGEAEEAPPPDGETADVTFPDGATEDAPDAEETDDGADAPDEGDGGDPWAGIQCWSGPCTTGTQVCCISDSTEACVAAGSCTERLSAGCDGPEDCSPGETCCVPSDGVGSTYCRAGGCLSSESAACHNSLQCLPGDSCCPGIYWAWPFDSCWPGSCF
jgi:hypothetical protein